MTALALWFGAAVVVGLLVGRCIRAGAIDQVAEAS
jgi:hypothetical protein